MYEVFTQPIKFITCCRINHLIKYALKIILKHLILGCHVCITTVMSTVYKVFVGNLCSFHL